MAYLLRVTYRNPAGNQVNSDYDPEGGLELLDEAQQILSSLSVDFTLTLVKEEDEDEGDRRTQADKAAVGAQVIASGMQPHDDPKDPATVGTDGP